MPARAHPEQAKQSLIRKRAILAVIVVPILIGIYLLSLFVVRSDLATGTQSHIDFRWAYQAAQFLLAGSDPYSQQYAQLLSGNPLHSPYPYPLSSLWLIAPLLWLPQDAAAAVWLTTLVVALVVSTPLLNGALPIWSWPWPLLLFTSLYALWVTQWTPIQILLLGICLLLFRRDAPFWSGFVAPLLMVKPTTGLGLLIFAVLLCGANRRWWYGAIAGSLLWYGGPLLLDPAWPSAWLNSLQVYANPQDEQQLVTIATFPPAGPALTVLAAAIAGWNLVRRRYLSLACTLLVLSIFLTPHRAWYDYTVLFIPLLYLPRRLLWLALVTVALTWLIPIVNIAGYSSTYQLLILALPSMLGCLLIQDQQAAFAKPNPDTGEPLAPTNGPEPAPVDPPRREGQRQKASMAAHHTDAKRQHSGTDT